MPRGGGARRALRGAGVEEQFGPAVGGVPLDDIERLVDGATDDGVEELERIFAAEQVEPYQCGGGGTSASASTPARAARVA